MKEYRADLHIHTLLSPCGDLDMSPVNIISEALRKGLDIIGITDHNSTRQASVVGRLGEKQGILVMRGAEVTTKEEVHCLAFFEKDDTLEIFQEFLDDNIPDFTNNPLLFGDQVAVDENEVIVYTENRLLINATVISISELGKWVREHRNLYPLIRQDEEQYLQPAGIPSRRPCSRSHRVSKRQARELCFAT